MNLHALVVALALAAAAAAQAQRSASSVAPEPVPPSPPGAIAFTPPDPGTIPNLPLGDMIQFGRDVFVYTQKYAKKYVGNGLNCVNCHLDAGRLANSAPLWAAYVAYPAFRTKNMQINTFEQRLEGCFRYSMNGTMPPADSAVVVGLISYAFWLATGAPVGAQLAGRGFPAVPEPAQKPDVKRGAADYATHCAACHGDKGQGLKADGVYTFPPLWGRDSYNAGAGMHRVATAAAFIKANMPMGQGGTLTDQQAWDLAAFVNSHPRPKDPRGRTPPSQ
ncbi:MAG: c-type cytochrome [Burkholderiales bacterium]